MKCLKGSIGCFFAGILLSAFASSHAVIERDSSAAPELPVEMWNNVLSFLTSEEQVESSLVCSTFNFLNKHHLLGYVQSRIAQGVSTIRLKGLSAGIGQAWANEIKSLYLIHNEGDQPIDSTIHLLDHFPRLMELTLCRYSDIKDTHLELIAEKCPHLRRLILWRCPGVTVRALKVFAEKSEEIEELGLVKPAQITDDDLREIIQNCPKLITLDIAKCREITDAGLAAIAKKHQDLSKVVGERSEGAVPDDVSFSQPDLIDDATGAGSEVTGTKCQGFRRLGLWGGGGITFQSLQSTVQQCENLEELRLRQCVHLRNTDLECMAVKCPNLKRLDLYKCLHLTGASIRNIVEKCKNIEALNLGHINVSDKDLEHIAKHGKNLSELILSGCITISGKGFKGPFNRLTKLDLCECTGINDLEAIVAGCPHLRELSLLGCYQITSNGLQNAIEKCPRLTQLDLCEVGNTDDNVLRGIVEHGKGIRKLNLTRCSKITNVGLQALASGCQNLRELNLRECGYDGIDAINGEGFKTPFNRLTKLDLYGCTNINDDDLKTIVAGCPQLRELNIGGCPLITIEGLRYVVEHCRHLKKVDIVGSNTITAGDLRDFASVDIVR